jgi:hypothetical protein
LKYLLTLLSIIFTFFLLEVFVRIFIDNGLNYEIEMVKYANQLKKVSLNKKIGIEHKKNINGKFMGVEVKLDKDGFRSSHNYKNYNNKIIMLGDSMTFGWGAQYTFSDHLNIKINTHDILNAGIGNTNTIMQINNFFENFSKNYKYDIIILNFFINDFETVRIQEPNFLQQYSYFYTYINNKINTILIKFRIKDDWKNFYSKNYLNEEIKLETLNLIYKLNKFCLENEIKFIIHNIPELRDLNNYKFENETKIIEKFAKSNNITFLNSHDVLKKYNEESLWVTKLDPHANDRAHKVISEYLFRNIRTYLD